MFSWKYIGNTEVKRLILKWLLVYYNSITTPQTYHLKLIHTRIRVSERQQLSNKTINMAVFYTGYTTNTHMQNKWSVLHGKITFFCFFFYWPKPSFNFLLTTFTRHWVFRYFDVCLQRDAKQCCDIMHLYSLF